MLKSLKLRIFLLALAPLLVVALSTGLLNYRALNGFGAELSALTEEAIMASEKNRLKTLMDTVDSLIQPYLAMPGISGREEGLKLLQSFRFDDGNGYLFGHTYEGVRLLHLAGNSAIGKNLWDTKDQSGQYIFRDMTRIAKEGGGFYTYYFPKPGEEVAEPKYSYVLGIDQWNMSIGTGVYIDSVDQVLGEFGESQSHSQSVSLFSNAAFIGVLLLVTLVISVIAIRSLLNGMNALSQSVEHLSHGEGDLTIELPQRNIDVLDRISSYFNRFTRYLAEDIKVLKISSDKLTGMSADASVKQQDLLNEVNQQRENTVQVATAVEEMSSTASEIAANAENTREIAESVSEEINQVMGQVSHSSTQIDGLNEVLVNVDQSVQELGNNVEAISSVLAVIQGISEQTNLLALNAAIEAARAGEQGRGFAVVADEVRTLAQRSQQSTVEIGDILEKLKSSSERSVKDMASTSESSNGVIEAMNRITELVESTTSSIDRLTEMNMLVATAATEQSTVSMEISKSINEIAGSAESIGEQSDETVKRFQEVEVLAKQVDSVSNKFKV